MRLTDNGLDWERIRPEDFDLVADIATEGSKGCDGEDVKTKEGWYYTVVNHDRYEAQDGTLRCAQCALDALREADGRWNSPLREALDNALGTTRKEIRAAHLREAV